MRTKVIRRNRTPPPDLRGHKSAYLRYIEGDRGCWICEAGRACGITHVRRAEDAGLARAEE